MKKVDDLEDKLKHQTRKSDIFEEEIRFRKEALKI